jgi:uncharacterized membrane protein
MRLKRKKTLFTLLALMCLSTLATGAGLHYRFRLAGNFPGANYTVPFGISATRIVGYYSAPGVLDSYVQTGKAFVQVVPFGAVTSYLFAINRNGLAVGGYCVPGCNPYTGEHAYTYDDSTGAVTSIDFPGAISTTGYGISDLGKIVGGYCSASIVCPPGPFLPADHGFLDDNGVFTTLDFPGAEATEATGINSAGVIIGTYDVNLTGPHSFIYQNGVYTNIDFPGANFTSASSINNNGVVAGLFQDKNFVTHGFLYFKGKFTQIDAPGALQTGLSAINDSNDLVGLVYPSIGSQPFKGIPVH